MIYHAMSLTVLKHFVPLLLNTKVYKEHCGLDRMAVGFTTTCAISAYHL